MTEQGIQASTPSYGAPVPAGAGLIQVNGVWTVSGANVSTAGKRFVGNLLDGLLMLVTLFIGWLIWSFIIWGKGQTPAKALLGMRCVNKNTGRAAGWGTMFLREFVGKQLLGMVTLGITTLVSCFMVFGASRDTIWDKLGSTAVVDDPTGRLAP